jgi:hypothetical protein
MLRNENSRTCSEEYIIHGLTIHIFHHIWNVGLVLLLYFIWNTNCLQIARPSPVPHFLA